jgi:hypothetical protein
MAGSVHIPQLEAAPDTWVEKQAALRFLLGELCLYHLRIPAWIRRTHFTLLTKTIPDPEPLMASLKPGLQAVMLPSQPVEGKLSRISSQRSSIRYIPAHYVRYYVDIQGSFQNYLKKFSAKPRSTLLRKVKKFSDFAGARLDCREFQSADEVPEFHRLACGISRLTYQSTLLQAGVPETPEYQDILIDLARQGKFRGFILFNQEVPIAFAHCSVSPQGLTYETPGYDPAYAKWSPGTVLLYVMFERLFAEGRPCVFDFGAGEAQYKSFFSTGSVDCADVYFFRKTIRNYFWIFIHTALDRLSTGIVKGMAFLGVKDAVKRFMRRGSSSAAQ